MKPNKPTTRPNIRTGWQQSFWRFCFSREQLWDWTIPVLLCLVGYIVLRWAYPYPATYADSFTYLRTAIDDQFSIFRPFGFSEWLRVVHTVSPSIHALFIVQTILYALCTTLLILALKRYYPVRPTWLRWVISILIVASPVAFYMLNTIMSDALFGCMVILMIAMLMVIFHEGSYIALLLYFVAFTVALFTRYSGMFFAVILLPILCFVPHKPCRWISLVGTALICVVFYQNICNHMYDTIRHRQFSTGFDGWQLANNAIHIIPFIDTDADEQPSDKDMRMLHDITCTHFRDYICQKTDSGKVATAVFMWDSQSPLKQYMFYHMQKTHTSYPVAWARLGGGLYADYGKWLILHHPVEFCRYFLNHNIPLVFYPSNLEMVGKYTPVAADNREIPEWYGIAPADMTRTVHPFYERGLRHVLPAIDLFFWIVMIGALLAMLIRWKHRTMTRAQRLTFWLILLIGFIYCGSTAFASPITIRNWFPLQALKLALTTCCLYAAIPRSDHATQPTH